MLNNHFQVLVCNVCVSTNHESHNTACELVQDIIPQAKEEIEQLVTKTIKKSVACAGHMSTLKNAVRNLRVQSQNAEELVGGAYKLYKDLLKKCRDRRLQEIKKLTAEREAKIFEASYE